MATRTLSVVIVGDASKLRSAFTEAESGSAGFGAKLDSVSEKMRSTGTAMTLGVTLPIVAGFTMATKAAVEEEASIGRLDQAVHRNWGFTKQQTEAVEDQITKWQNATGILDDKLRPALANLARAGMDWTQSQKTMNVVMDIAIAKNLDVETVAKAVAKAYDGNVGALGRLGIATKDAAGNTLTFDQIMQRAAETMGGAAAKHAETAAGKMEILRAKFADVQENLGAALIPILTQLGDVLATVADAFTSLSPEMQQMIVIVGLAVAAVGPLLTIVGNLKRAFDLASTAVSALAVGAMNPWVIGMGAAVIAIGGVVAALKMQSDSLQVNIDKMRELNNQQMVKLVDNLMLMQQATGNSNLVHQSFAKVLAEDSVQAQRFIEALGSAGYNTDWYTQKLESHIQKQVETQEQTDASRATVEALTQRIKEVPASVTTQVYVAGTSEAQAALDALHYQLQVITGHPWQAVVQVTNQFDNMAGMPGG